MPRVSRMRLGTWRADRPRRMASRMRFTRSGWKVCPDAIFRNRTTRSSPSLLYWGTHRLSSTSSKASTVEAERKQPHRTLSTDHHAMSPVRKGEYRATWTEGCLHEGICHHTKMLLTGRKVSSGHSPGYTDLVLPGAQISSA